ncbi:MAG TPA: hypothetical protein VLE95_02055 [Chlamydiales bacterium]|nr:hypothetical protein [Chlamydiales bacterium]
MASRVAGTLEQGLAEGLLYGFSSPLTALTLELCETKTPEERLSVTQKFIVKHLPKDKKSTAVDAQDAKLPELFDEAMKNMARDTVQKALREVQTMKSFVETQALLASLKDSFKPKTWQDSAFETINRSPLLRKGVNAARSRLLQLGVISEESQPEEDTFLVLIEEDEGWDGVETGASYVPRVFSILERWQKDPSALLETSPAKGNLNVLRNIYCRKPELEEASH